MNKIISSSHRVEKYVVYLYIESIWGCLVQDFVKDPEGGETVNMRRRHLLLMKKNSRWIKVKGYINTFGHRVKGYARRLSR